MKKKVLLADEDLKERKRLRKYIEWAGNCQIVAECDNCLDAMEVIRSSPIDLLFLDVEMPDMSGMDFLRSFSPRPDTILTSTYDTYALEGFSLDVLDYLLKPFTFKRFMMAMDKHTRSRPEPLKLCSPGDSRHDRDFIYVREKHRTIKVRLGEICFMEELNGSLTILTENQRIQATHSLDQIEKELPDGAFIRIHGKYLVAVTKIRAFSPQWVELDQTTLPIERKFRAQAFQRLHYSLDFWCAS